MALAGVIRAWPTSPARQSWMVITWPVFARLHCLARIAAVRRGEGGSLSPRLKRPDATKGLGSSWSGRNAACSDWPCGVVCSLRILGIRHRRPMSWSVFRFDCNSSRQLAGYVKRWKIPHDFPFRDRCRPIHGPPTPSQPLKKPVPSGGKYRVPYRPIPRTITAWT